MLCIVAGLWGFYVLKEEFVDKISMGIRLLLLLGVEKVHQIIYTSMKE